VLGADAPPPAPLCPPLLVVKNGLVETKKTAEAEYTARHRRAANLRGTVGLFDAQLARLRDRREGGYTTGESLEGQIGILEVAETIVRVAQVRRR
jgi:hypothetical protein